MKYWDTSGLASLLLTDAHSDGATAILSTDPHIATWWATYVECQSAIWNNERKGLITTLEAESAQRRLIAMRKLWMEIPPSEDIRGQACRLLRIHDLRAADALQLAAALFAADGSNEKFPFVTNDRRLALAARREGFPVLTNKDCSS